MSAEAIMAIRAVGIAARRLQTVCADLADGMKPAAGVEADRRADPPCPDTGTDAVGNAGPR